MLPDTNIGPVTTPAQYRKILDYMEIAKAEGVRCILGGGPAASPELPGGQFVEPTIFVDVRPDTRIAREEVFGPVLSVISFDERRMRSESPTTPSTAWRRACGPAMSAARCACPALCVPAPSGSTPTAP